MAAQYLTQERGKLSALCMRDNNLLVLDFWYIAPFRNRALQRPLGSKWRSNL